MHTFDGRDVFKLQGEELRLLRRDMQIIFQDPYSSLNPRLTVKGLLREVMRFHRTVAPQEMDDRINELIASESLGLASSRIW